MSISILSYNTLFNSALDELPSLLKKHSPDIICLQEVWTDEANLKRIENLGYKLAESANSFVRLSRIYGVTTFYNKKTIGFSDASLIDLNTDLSEYFYYIIQVILGYNQPKTIIKTDFIYKETKKKFSVCNLHLYVIGSNNLRVNHLNYALKSIKIKDFPALVICGDFNYFPFQRKKLEKTMSKFKLVEATKGIRQTMSVTGDGVVEEFTWFQKFFIPFFNRFIVKHIKTDYVFYRGLKLIKSIRLEDKHSDHYPILTTFNI